MSYPDNGTITDPTAGTPRVMVSSDGLDEQLTITTASKAPLTKVPKTSKPGIDTRGVVASVATGLAIALALWLTYFAIRVLMRALRGRRYRRQAEL